MNKLELLETREITKLTINQAEIITAKEIKSKETKGIKDITTIDELKKGQYRTRINGNEYVGIELLRLPELTYNIDEILEYSNIKDCKYSSVSLGFDFYSDDSFEKYKKLNMYLVNLIQQKYNLENYQNDYMYVYFNDLSKNDDEVAGARLEFTKLQMDSETQFNDIVYLLIFWNKVLNDLTLYFNSYNQRVNKLLVEKYYNTDPKVKEWNSIYSFVVRHQMMICSRKQLIDLLDSLGVKNPLERAKAYKKYNDLEFFTKGDIEMYCKILKQKLNIYFNLDTI